MANSNLLEVAAMSPCLQKQRAILRHDGLPVGQYPAGRSRHSKRICTNSLSKIIYPAMIGRGKGSDLDTDRPLRSRFYASRATTTDMASQFGTDLIQDEPFRRSQPFLQPTLLLETLGLGLAILYATLTVALANTIVLFVAVTLIGLWRCRVTALKLQDPRLNILTTLWPIKVALTLLILYAGWMPQLASGVYDYASYDPQRYYFQGYELIQNGWVPPAEINYLGIIFYYGAIFYVFGHNPVIPALVNILVTLLGMLYLISTCYQFKKDRGPRDWTIALILLVPEFLWFDVLTARETLSATLLLFACLVMGRYFVNQGRTSLLRSASVAGACLFGILAVRTTMAIPIIVAVVLMALLLRPARRTATPAKMFFVALSVGLLVVGPMVQNFLGGYNVNYLESLQSAQSLEGNIAGTAVAHWSQGSIGLLLAPHNSVQAVAFLLPRMVVYLIAPLPSVPVSLSGLMSADYISWQELSQVLTSFILLIAAPYVAAGAFDAWNCRKRSPGPLVLYITFLVTLAAIAGGNIIIQERYRLMATLLIFACAWISYTTCAKRSVARWAVAWYGVLMAGGALYVGLKF